MADAYGSQCVEPLNLEKMKLIKSVTSVVVLAIVMLLSATSANAQLKFGLKAGAAINDLKFSEDVFSKENRAGFTGGIMLEFTVPVIGLGFDASAMYVHRSVNAENTEDFGSLTEEEKDGLGRDYIDIPINLKYKLNLPGVGSVIKPFVTTGPSFAFLVSKKAISDALKNKTCDIAWNFGFGIELFSKVQVAASYGLGLTNTLEYVNLTGNKETIEGKNRYWTVTAAYLF